MRVAVKLNFVTVMVIELLDYKSTNLLKKGMVSNAFFTYRTNLYKEVEKESLKKSFATDTLPDINLNELLDTGKIVIHV